MRKFVPLLATLLLVAPAQAQEEQLAQEAGETSTDEQDERSLAEIERGQEMICRRERVTGSLTRVNRVCMTRDEWNGVSDTTRESMNTANRRASGGVECRLDQFGGCAVSGAGQSLEGGFGF